jgi:excisionase family DNA binding protein
MNDTRLEHEGALLKVGEVAEMLRVSRALAYRLIRSGELPGVQIGHAVRVLASDLEEYVKRCRKGDLSPQIS